MRQPVKYDGSLKQNALSSVESGKCAIPKFLMFSLPLSLLLILLLVPLGMDNSLYQSMAIDFIHYHKIPYLGTWDQNFPGILIFHSLAILLFGNAGIGYRALDIFLQCGFCIILYRLWSIWFKKETAWLAVFVFVCYYVRSGYDVEGQRDLYGILLTLCSLYFIIRKKSNYQTWDVVLSGLFLGIAVLIKPTFLAYGILTILFIIGIQNKVRSFLYLCCALIPIALTIVIYSFIPGGLRAYWLATGRFNMDLYTTFGGSFSDLIEFISPIFISLPVLFGLLPLRSSHEIQFFEKRPVKREKLLYLSFIVFSLVSVLIQRKFLQYHFAPWAVLLTPFAAFGIKKFLSYFSNISWAFYLSLIILIILALPKKAVLQSLQDPTHAPEIFEKRDMISNGMQYDYVEEVTKYLDSPRNKNGRIEICSFYAQLRARLARDNATRYPSLHGIGLRIDPSNPNSFTNYQLTWRKAYIDSLWSIQPRFIVLARLTDCWYLHDPYTDLLHNLKGFDSLLDNKYHLDTIIGTFQVYRLNTDTALH